MKHISTLHVPLLLATLLLWWQTSPPIVAEAQQAAASQAGEEAAAQAPQAADEAEAAQDGAARGEKTPDAPPSGESRAEADNPDAAPPATTQTDEPQSPTGPSTEQQEADAAERVLESMNAKFNYTVGHSFGQDVRQKIQPILGVFEFDLEIFLRGFRDAFAGQSLLSEDQMHEIRTELDKEFRLKQQQLFNELAEKN